MYIYRDMYNYINFAIEVEKTGDKYRIGIVISHFNYSKKFVHSEKTNLKQDFQNAIKYCYNVIDKQIKINNEIKKLLK